MPSFRSSLLPSILVWLSCSTWLLIPAASTTRPDCPPQVDNVLAGADYRACQQAFPSASGWVLTTDNVDALGRNDACLATLRALEDVEFRDCVANIATGDSRVKMRVAVEKKSLDALASGAAATRHLLRHQDTRLLDTEPATVETSSSSYNYDYVYVGVAAFVVVLLVSCLLSRGRACCFCIPIPICC